MEDEDNFKCNLCDKAYRYEGTLKTHIAKVTLTIATSVNRTGLQLMLILQHLKIQHPRGSSQTQEEDHMSY